MDEIATLKELRGNYKTGLYSVHNKTGRQAFVCICGSYIQSRNINNHFETNKHREFLLNSAKLIKEYENLTREELHIKIRALKKGVKQKKTYYTPITITFD